MKKIHKLLCGLVALTTAACSSDETALLDQQPPTDNKGQVVSVTAYAPGNNGSSRIAFDPSYNSETGYCVGMTWDNEDSFSIIRDGINSTFTKAAADNTFQGVLPGEEGTFYALYPTNEEVTGTTFTMDLSSQTGSLNDASTYMRATSDGNNEFEFSHLTAVLKPTLGLPNDANIKQIKVTTNVANKVNPIVDLTTGMLYGGTGNIITIDYSISPVPANTDVYIYFPPIASAKKDLEFEVITDEQTDDNNDKIYIGRLAAAENGSAIEAGKVYHATVGFKNSSPCKLPKGTTFRTTISEAIGEYNVTSIVFEVESEESIENAISIESTGNASYAKVIDGTILKVFTSGHTFVFNEDCSGMFNGAAENKIAKITNIDWGSNINTENVTNMAYMFDNCRALTSIDLSRFNTANVTDMSGMFFNCNLTSLDLSNFNTTNVTDMFNMFGGCSYIQELDIRTFDISKVTSASLIFSNLGYSYNSTTGNKAQIYITSALRSAFEAKYVSPSDYSEFVIVDAVQTEQE